MRLARLRNTNCRRASARRPEFPLQFRFRIASGNESIAIDQRTPGNSRHPLAGNQYASQVHWIGPRKGDALLIMAVPRGPQSVDSFMKRKLLSAKPAHKAPSANLASIFKPAQHSQ